MAFKRILGILLSASMMISAAPQLVVHADALISNGVNTVSAVKTAQWTANGKGDDAAGKYDLLISYYSANYYQTAYMGFDLPEDFNPDFVQSAKLKLTTAKLDSAITSSVYGADYSGFENGGTYEKAENAPAFDPTAIATIVPAVTGGIAECDVTDYLKNRGSGDDVAFRLASGKGYTGWNIGSCNNGGTPPQLEIEYDNGEGAHTVPEQIDYGHGSITFDKPGFFEAGEKITLTVIPDEHYELDGLVIDGKPVETGADNTYTFSMPARNVNENYIKATFRLADYIKTRNIYEDNMLLQRDKPVYIDGICKNIGAATAYLYKGEELAQEKKVAIENDEWNVTFDAVSDYTTVYKIIIEGDNARIQMDNVLFGDVYLFSGQSNMWKEVSYYKNADHDYTKENVEKHLTDKIRVMYTKGSSCYGETNPAYDAAHKDPWRDFSSYSNISPLPAVAFSAATELYENNGNIPVGVIANAYPGSYISCWFPNTGIDPCNSNRNKNSNERNWYNGRIYPIRNLELSGVFWYQGEADSAVTYHSPQYEYYVDMMPKLISSWRELFGNNKLPFYYVQLCRLGETRDENNPNTTSNGGVYIKQAQTDTYINAADKTNIGLVSTLDLYGRYEYSATQNDANCRNDIHPGQKRLIGERLAAYALEDIYNKDVCTNGPVPKSALAENGKVVVTYDCTGSLKIMDSSQYADSVTAGKIKNGTIDANVLNEFEVAGIDGKWYDASARITAANQVTVYSDQVIDPAQVRYAYEDYPEAPNLTDDSDLPSYVFKMEAAKGETPLPEEKRCVKITADYKPDGSLAGVATEEIKLSDIGPVENTPIHKVFYWESLESMKPVKTGASPTLSPTIPPTLPPADTDQSFTFGTGSIAADTAYGQQPDGMTYGFVGIEGALIENSRFDGFRYSEGEDLMSKLKNGNGFVETDYSAYDDETVQKMGEGEIPVRFALQAKKDGYYTVTATVVNTSKTEETEVSLFSELRHFILYKRKLAPGESITKTFNIHLASTYVSGTGVLEDEVINVCVSGRNAGLKSVSIKEQAQTGKTIWLMTDSTGADQLSGVPYFGLQNYGGTGQVISKYINPEIAVSNQGEGGLDTTDTVHFDNAVSQMKEGDYLYVQYGFNDSKDMGVYKRNLEKYYTAAHKKGVKLILVSPTERQNVSANWDNENNKWTASNGAYAIADKEFTEAKIAAGADDIAFVDVNTAFVDWMNEAMQTMLAQRKKAGFDDEELDTRLMEYYFRCGWTFSRDSVHINEAGADNAGYLFVQEAKKVIAADPDGVQAKVLAELMENAPGETPYVISGQIIAEGWAPNDSYPYPNTKQVEFQYPAMVKAVDSSNGALNSMSVKVQGEMSKYAQGVAEILNQNNEAVKTIYTVSTDKNPAIGHIDNTSAQYSEIITMYFDRSENLLESGYTYKVYLLPLENGADQPESGPYYSSIYTQPPQILEKLITSTDGSGSECFDYTIEEGASIRNQGGNSASGAVQWQFAGSATAQTYAKTIKDGQTAAHLYTNGSGTYALTKFFNSGKNIASGKIHMHFQINHTYGYFGIKLTSSTKIGSWMEGMQVLSVEDGILKLYDGTEAGAVKGGKWTDVDVWIDLDRCTQTVSIAGGDPVTGTVKQLDTSDKSAVASLLPVRGLSIMYMDDPNSLSNFAFDTYLTDLSIATVETNTPQINVNAVVDQSCTGMGTISGSGEFDIHSDVMLAAVPEEGYNLLGWYTAGGTLYSTNKNLTMERICQDISLTAKFVVQRGKEYITSFEIASSKQAIKAGSDASLVPVNAMDTEGNATVEITAKDVVWDCTETGINITEAGILTVSDAFAMENNEAKTITVTAAINGYTMSKKIIIYSYAYYDVISERADFDGTFKTIANKAAIVWPGERQTSVYKLSENIVLDKDTKIKYSNAWDGENTSGKNRVITFKDKDGNTVFSMYYTWAVLYLSADKYLGAVSKNTWTDVTVNISYDLGEIVLSVGGNSVTGTIDKGRLTDISFIELSTPAGCPADRLLGISDIIISQ